MQSAFGSRLSEGASACSGSTDGACMMQASPLKMKPVVSASRRIDMLASCPERLLHILETRFPPEQTHTLVLWTKDPGRIVSDAALRTSVSRYASVFLHVSVTGMGGTDLEPRVPSTGASLEALGQVIDRISGPDHVAVRFDPIVHLRLADGRFYSNLDEFETVAERAAGLGVRRIIVSWMQVYRKVHRRLERLGIEPVDPPSQRQEAEHLSEVAGRLGMEVRGCCVPGWPRGACIDGRLFRNLHPGAEACSVAKARGQRELCGCTHSIDIGWYGPCVHGCVYCYANPTFYGPG